MISKEFSSYTPNKAAREEMRRAYEIKRKYCAKRGMQWELTLAEFRAIWRPYWRDKTRHRLMLCRTGFKGPWAVGNVRIDIRSNMVRDQQARARELGLGGFVYDLWTAKEIVSQIEDM